MRNCFFEDSNFSTTIKPISFIKEDGRGYFIEVRINKTDVVKFIENGVVPNYVDDKNMFMIARTSGVIAPNNINHFETIKTISSLKLTNIAILLGTHKNSNSKQIPRLKKPAISINKLFFFIMLQ